MSLLMLGLLIGLSAGYFTPGDSPCEKTSQDAAVMQEGAPSLQGRVVDEVGRPLPGAKVILYAGFATRKKIKEAQTDADGRYRFDSVRSTMVMDKTLNRWDQYLGVRIEPPTHVEADGHSWRDIRIPGVAGHVETVDIKLTPAGHIDGRFTDKSGKPLGKLDLRILLPTGSRGHGVRFNAYATTDDQGRFRSISLFPGEYDVEVNSTTLDYAKIGTVTVQPGETVSATFDKISLPEVIEGVVQGTDGKPLDGVEVTLLAKQDSGIELHRKDELMIVRSRAWTITRPRWQERFQLAYLPGLEGAGFVLAAHELGWAKVPVESLRKGEPIKLQPWGR